MDELTHIHICITPQNKTDVVELHLNDDPPISFPYGNPHVVMERIARFCLQLWHEQKLSECPF
jgi:hypothetical protein